MFPFPMRLLSVIAMAAAATLLSQIMAVQVAFAAPLLPDGMLLRGVSDTKVYYIQDGKRRWIENELAFAAQGFRWTDVTTVDDAALAAYPAGADIIEAVNLGLPLERALLPDLAPAAGYDLRYATIGGRTALKFTATFWNRGKGAFELNAQSDQDGDGDHPASQRIFHADGAYRDVPVGVLFWHDVHVHYHYDDFGEYRLELVRPASGTGAGGSILTQKTTFCMRDDTAMAPAAEGPDQPRKYGGCEGGKQGVSVGWADVYPYTLPDQYFDVQGLPKGIYKLSFDVDPERHFTESRRDNNVSVTLVELDPAARTLRVVADMSPYATSSNRYPEHMLVQAEGDGKVYVVNGGKKRHLKDEAVFASYGYSWSDVYVLPRGVVNAIPNERLVRMKGAPQIFLLNDALWRRKLLDPSVMASYGWTNAPVAEVTETEFASYPETDLIVRSGEAYSLNRKEHLGTHDSLRAKGYPMASVHLVNDHDFKAYGTGTAARDLAVPWDVVFLPDGDLLVTERPGTLRRIGKTPAEIDIPDVLHTGEGGLMGMALHPEFAANGYVYLYFTTAENGQRNRIQRFRLEGARLIEDKMILDAIPAALYHDGGQIAFGPDGMLYVTTGDANSPDLAQDLASLAGKTLRLTPEGGIPSDNPFGTYVWSYGHRNAQGIAWDAQGRMWQTEHGRSGALSGYDELNLIEKGKNYGWPVIQGDMSVAGMERPVRHSGANVTWAPSGLAYVGGSLFFAGLKGETLYEAKLDAAGNVAAFTEHFKGVYGRLRGVALGPDALYVSTSNRDGRGAPKAGDDKLIRVHPDFLP